ncbi:hypothetical protein ACSXEK_15820 (plasmid) [Clostridium perfringens]
MNDSEQYWNYDRLSYNNTDEFKYLDKIDSHEYNNIKNNRERMEIDFNEINNKLGDISNLIKVKLGEIRGR